MPTSASGADIALFLRARLDDDQGPDRFRPGRRLRKTILTSRIPIVSDNLPPCPQCSSEYTYELGALLVCPECAHEWSLNEDNDAADAPAIKDAVGNELRDGDTVTVIKDLKIKGSSSVVKVGTRVKNIRLVNGVGDHDIDCKVDGIGPMQLKSSVVKKV